MYDRRSTGSMVDSMQIADDLSSKSIRWVQGFSKGNFVEYRHLTRNRPPRFVHSLRCSLSRAADMMAPMIRGARPSCRGGERLDSDARFPKAEFAIRL